MRIKCFKCTADPQVKQQLWALIYNKPGWISDHISYMLYYFPPNCVDFALIIDPTLEPLSKEDYII